MNNSPFQPLHPTLKKCKCGQTFSRSQLYRHLELQKHIFANRTESMFQFHGEVPLRVNDPVLSNNLNAR